MQSILPIELPPIIKAKKKVITPALELSKNNWKPALQQLRETYMLAKYVGCRDFGTPIKIYSDTKTNTLTAAVCDYIKYIGGDANRISTTGTYRGGKWTYGTTRNGTSDIHAIIKGRAISIEIKCSATGDTIKPDQLKEKARIESAGGIYIIIKNMQSFHDWYTANY